jgi:glycosyltransferase involved in cell wall biosynthesis
MRTRRAVRALLVHNTYRSEGGEERHVDLLEEWLPRVGVDVARLDVPSPQDPSPAERLRLGLTLAYRPRGARLLREAIEAHKPDIVHFHNVLPLLTAAAMREAHARMPVVLTIHNYRFACPAGTLLRNGRVHDDCLEGSSLLCGLKNARGDRLESIAYGLGIEIQRRLGLFRRWVDAYVCPSWFVAAALSRAGYPRDRIYTIYHGVPAPQRSSAVGDFALYAGRLSPEKGVETLIEASRLAPRVPVLIAGDGPLAGAVRRAAVESSSLVYAGRVDREKVAELLRGARFTLAPSSCFEGQPYGVLEAMATGRPVVASRLGGLEEIVDPDVTGLLVTPNDASALAAAMAQLWEDPARSSQMGERAWTFARTRCSVTRQTEHLATLYERMIVERRRRST